ncbi:MAG: alpha/beta hydrolase [Bacteroidota bacterium]
MKWTIIFVVTTVLFYGCGSGNMIKYPEPSNSKRDGDFYSKSNVYKSSKNKYNADYGVITVPENRRDAKSRLIHLPVIRIHAITEKPQEPIFALSGGPGMSNMNFVPIDSLLYDHDFVIVGYRGVDGSTVLDCPEVKKAFANGGVDLLNEKSLREIGMAWETSYNRFKKAGIDLNGYTISETVEDLETVRKSLNYKKINLISESYGTRVTYIYGLMYPEIIHRSVMIAFNPPGRFIYDPQRTDEQIKYYSYLWSKDSVLSKQCPDLAETMQKVLKDMPKKWLLFSINPGKVKIVTSALLYQRKTAAMVFDTFIRAEKGDYSGLALMSLMYNFVFPDMFVWGDLATKALSADFDSVKIFSVVDQPSELFGSPMNKLLWEPLKYGQFPIEMIPDSLRTPRKSCVETLILSGSIDFSTPAEYGKEFLPYLENGNQVIISEAGHVGDIRYIQKSAVEGLIADYINKGIVDTSEIKYIPMDFNVSFGFPTLAKTALGIMAVLTLLLTTSIIWIF